MFLIFFSFLPRFSLKNWSRDSREFSVFPNLARSKGIKFLRKTTEFPVQFQTVILTKKNGKRNPCQTIKFIKTKSYLLYLYLECLHLSRNKSKMYSILATGHSTRNTAKKNENRSENNVLVGQANSSSKKWNEISDVDKDESSETMFYFLYDDRRENSNIFFLFSGVFKAIYYIK